MIAGQLASDDAVTLDRIPGLVMVLDTPKG